MKTLGLLCGIGVLLSQTVASAQTDLKHPTVRLDTGAAVAVGSPQEDYFGPGGAGMLKLAFNLTPWLDVDPSVMTVQLSENTRQGPGSSVAGLWALGLGARLKRPHNVPDGNFWGLASPWIDADYQYYNTGGLGRMGVSVGMGISAPLDVDRHWWFGPMLRGVVAVDGTSVGGTPGFDTRDFHAGIIGVELEWDPVGHKKPAAPAVTPNHPTCFPVVDRVRHPSPLPKEYRPQTKMDPVEVTLHANETVPFDFDSAVLNDDAKNALNEIARLVKERLVADKNDPNQQHFKSVEVDGYASSENHPWAEKHNQKLSEQRAQMVVDFLVAAGVPSDVLSAKGFGTADPVASNDTEEGRKQNRRVEFVVVVSFVRNAEGGR